MPNEPITPYGNDTTSTFAAKVRQKFPEGVASDGRQYSAIPDDELAHNVIQKHPQYQTWLSTPEMERLTKQSFSTARPIAQNLGDLSEGMTGARGLWGPGGVADKAKSAGRYLLNNSPDTMLNDALTRVNDAGSDQLKAINSVPAGPAQGIRKVLAAVPGVGPTAERLTENPNFHDAGSLVGAGLATQVPALPGAAKNIANSTLPARQALAQKLVQPLVYEGVGEAGADARMGIHPDRALIDEGIWGTKKSMSKQLGQRVGELKPAANELLNNAPGSREWLDSSKHINSAIDDAIQTAKKDGITDTTRLENLRQSLLTQHGPTSGNPLSQNDLKTSIQKTAKRLGAYRNTVPSEASAADAAGSAASNIKNEVNSTVSEAAPMNNRMANAIDAQSGIDRSILADKGKDLLAHGTLNKIAQRTIGSAPVRSGAARLISLGSKLDIPSAPPTIGPGAQFASPVGPPAAQAWTPAPPQPPVPPAPGINPAHAAEGPPLWQPAVGDFHPNSMWKQNPTLPSTNPPQHFEPNWAPYPRAGGNGPVAPPAAPPVPSNLTGPATPMPPVAAPPNSGVQAAPTLPPLPPPAPINPAEAADVANFQHPRGIPATRRGEFGNTRNASEPRNVLASKDAENNITQGLTGNRVDEVGNTREANRAALQQHADQLARTGMTPQQIGAQLMKNLLKR